MFYRLILTVSVLFAATSAARAQSSFIYDTFVRECEKAGGRAATSREQSMRGERFVCDQSGKKSSSGASSGSSTNDPTPAGQRECEREVPIAVDWVFADLGARATFARSRNLGSTPFQAVVDAQGHNRPTQSMLLRCRRQVENYISQKYGNAANEHRIPRQSVAEPELTSHQLGPEDCRCLSVLPAGGSFGGRALYNVTNSCGPMRVSLHLSGDSLHLSPDPNRMRSTGNVGILSQGQTRQVGSAEGLTIINIAGYTLENRVSRYVCRF